MFNFVIDIFQGYAWYIILTHFVLAIILFFIINWIGSKAISVGYMQINIVIQEDTAPAFNFLFKVIAPVVFVVLCAVAFDILKIDTFKTHIYFIVIFYWIIRIIWIICSSRGRLMNWFEQLIYWSISIGLAIWVYSLIEQVEQILPDPRSLLDQLWILIIMFIYSILNNVHFSRNGTIKRKNNYINYRYNTFKKKYDHIIKEFFQNEFYEALTYSIMIYEDFNRPILVRWIEYIKFWITHKPHTLGIMQVMTSKHINNKDSIVLAMQKIRLDSIAAMQKYSSPQFDINHVAYSIAKKYNPGDYDYACEVQEIFEHISSIFYKRMPLSYNEIILTLNNEHVADTGNSIIQK